MVYPLPSIIR